MREPTAEPKCSAFEFLDIKAWLQKTGCKPGKPLPGQRITALPAVSQYPSILRRPTQPSTQPSRRVKFDLPSISSSSSETISEDAVSDEGYIGTDARCLERKEECSYAMKYRVQQIPKECLRELVALGALDRVLISYTRDIGKLAIDSFRPFRSLYFYGIVMFHLGKHKQVDFDEAATICEAAVVLNNATIRTTQRDPPSLLSFLDLSVEMSGNLTMPRANSEELRSSAWRSEHFTRLGYAMTAGKLVANLDEPAVLSCLDEHIAQQCIIRPVFDYMFFQFIETHETELPLRSESLQFQIYSTVREVMHRVYRDGEMPLAYVMYTTLFAIAETNDKIAEAVWKQNRQAELCSTILSLDIADNLTISSNDSMREHPLSSRELLCLLDWEFAAVLGYMLAHRYHEANQENTNMRAQLGALAFGVDSSQAQPFPPLLPMQDTQFHQFIRSHVSSIYAKWPHGFFYMVLDEAVDAYNVIIQDIRNNL